MGSHHLKLRPNYPRSRTGCLTCRVRKKKCDELKPRCAGCRRNQIACEWPSVVSDPLPVFIHHDSPPSTSVTINDPGQSDHSVVTSDLLAHGGSVLGIIQPKPQALNTVDRAAGLTPLSLLLLRHYVQETGPALAMRTPSDSPFLTTVLPLAYMDDLLMHSLLALSGTHLAYKQGSDHGILHATALHYSKALSGLRHEFAHLQDGTSPQEPRLLLVLMIICHYESLSADVGGAVFSHLKAGRQLALSLQSRLKSQPDRRTIDNEIAGFALEIYAYLLFVNNVTPYGAISNRTLPFDDFVLSLDSLSSFSTFGTMFAGAHELFELIPQISLLASQSIAEESAGQKTPSSELLARAEDLSARISSWTMAETRCTGRPGDWEGKLLAAAALQQGLHIYLATAKAGSTVKDPAVAVQIQGHVDAILHITEMLTDSEFDCTLLWPCVIGGSCMVIPEQQRNFTLRVLNNRHRMKHLKTICDTLQLLWDDDSPSSYGPHGLSVVMARNRHYLAIT